MTAKCNVCQSDIQAPVYQSNDEFSITSLAELIPGKTEIYFCKNCTHVTTTEIHDIEAYYANQYRLNINSDDEDQLYDVVNNVAIYRTDKQAELFLQKIHIDHEVSILDYGCGKAATLKKICYKNQSVTPHLFDVTDKHTDFWSSFVKAENYYCFNLPSTCKKRFDVITSFYAIEHIPDLKACLSTIHEMLVDDGIFYFMVPNMYQNVADFIVADHVNHFSNDSLSYLMSRSGFKDIEIDDKSFTAAFIVKATKSQSVKSQYTPSAKRIKETQNDVEESVSFWNNAKMNIASFEKHVDCDNSVGIYGAGFYGRFIISCISQPQNIVCFLDQNKHLHGKTMLDKPIVSPGECPSNVHNIIVGLNPTHAKQIMEKVAKEDLRDKHLFFL